MHIVYLCNEYPTITQTYGGVGMFTQTLSRTLVQHGHQVTIVGTYERTGRSTDQGVTVVSVPHVQHGGIGVFINALRLRQAIIKLHATTPVSVIDTPELGLIAMRPNFGPVRIIRMNGGHHFFSHTLGRKPRLFRSMLEKLSFAHADRLCAVSRYTAETTRQLLKLGSCPIAILPNPVDTARFAPQPTVKVVNGRIIFVGTLTEKKGIRQLVQAMPQIRRAIPRAHLMVYGRDKLDPLTRESFLQILQRTVEPTIADHITFCGPAANEHLPSLLATAELCVYPSHMETQGIVVCEAMAVGRPVVASIKGPGPEVIEHGSSGLLCNPHNPADIAEKVITVLSDARLAEQLGAAGRVRAVEHFSLDVLVKRNEDFYQSL